MKRRSLLWVSLFLILAIFLSACGGNSSDDEIAVGDPAPNFTLTDSDGNLVSLADYEGQPVLLFFHMAGG